MEEVGSGTNKIVKWCREWGLPDPVFEYTGTSIVVTLKKAQKTREKILRLIKENPEVTTAEIAKEFSITSKGAEWNIGKLKKEGFIKPIGPDKGGHWEIL